MGSIYSTYKLFTVVIPSIKMTPLCEWDNEFSCNLLSYDDDNYFFEDRKGMCYSLLPREKYIYLSLTILSSLLAEQWTFKLKTVCRFQSLNSNLSWTVLE